MSAKAGETLLLLGNEAIARAAIEAGVDLAATYPGTPSSEIGLVLDDVAKDAGLQFQYAVNEKVAMEVGASAAIGGLKSLVFMKHVGMNVAADVLMTLAYTGVRGGMVVVTADDPGCHSSQNEQDNRIFAKFANLPLLEPATAQECLDLTKFAFELSAFLELPVVVRTTTRVSHSRGPVTVGDRVPPKGTAHFDREPNRFVMLPANAREGHKRVLQKMRLAEGISESTPFNRIEDLGKKGDIGIIASGPAYLYLMEFADDLVGKVFKLGLTNPVPRSKLTNFLRGAKRVLVLEVLEPYLEDQIRALANEFDIRVDVYGKAQGLVPRTGELDPDLVAEALVRLDMLDPKTVQRLRDTKLPKVPVRPPVLCPGCGHRGVAYAARQASRRQDVLFPVDIGCYSLVEYPPTATGDILLCMGSSIGTAAGLAATTDKKILAFIGDSTFYHAGIPALIHAVHQGLTMTVCIMDNGTTAMTGHQPHPGIASKDHPAVDMEGLVKACGVHSVETYDAYDVKALTKAFRHALDREGVSVIIARHECRLLELRDLKAKGEAPVLYEVIPEKCTKCGFCIDAFACPALVRLEDEGVMIDLALCNGCGVCADVCPPKAIV
ncbi:MAG TPA: indolepyruvate ferredoxin oxidoreductase subunit alpha, partial [Thermoplasmata archaeon]|nr:indolepyruvate ferredoxin oxidoreductase subunit alpha [Thermoplasmata archaeon]